MAGKSKVKKKERKTKNPATVPYRTSVLGNLEVDMEDSTDNYHEEEEIDMHNNNINNNQGEVNMSDDSLPEHLSLSKLQKRHHDEKIQLRRQIETLKLERLKFNKKNPVGKKNKQNLSKEIKRLKEEMETKHKQEVEELMKEREKTKSPPNQPDDLFSRLLPHLPTKTEIQVHFPQQVQDFNLKKSKKKKNAPNFQYVSRPITSKAAEQSLVLSIEQLTNAFEK